MKLKRSLLVFLGIVFSIGLALPAHAEGTVADTSISDKLAGATTSGVVVVPSPDGGNNKSYAGTVAGLKEALYDLYEKGNNGDFAIYFGANITNMSGAVDKTLSGAPSATNMTFTALEGKVKTLVLTSTTADAITNNTGTITGAKTLTLGTNAYFGTNLVLRNITYTGTNLYMNGHDLSLNGNSQGNGLSVYGGSDNSDVTGSPTITVNATGSGTWNFYGGNESGILTGNPTVKINNTTGAISNLSGGSKTGTVNGNIKVDISGFTGNLNNYYGGGVGTASNTANVTGNIETTIKIENSSTSFRLGTYYGGVHYGNVDGTIKNDVSGYGGYMTGTPNFTGGSRNGNIGTDQTRDVDVIVTNLDSSKFSTGQAEFSGGNNDGTTNVVTAAGGQGVIKGNIVNTLKAGKYDVGSFYSVNGGGKYIRVVDLMKGSDANYDSMPAEERRAYAESVAHFKVYGDITTKILGGCAAGNAVGNPTYARGAGVSGYVEGNTSISAGVANEDGSAGGAGFVYSYYARSYADTGIPYLNSNHDRSLGFNWDIVGGGGNDPVDQTYMFVQGNTSTELNNVAARWTYGGGFSGVIQGNTSNVLRGGVVDTLEGAGYAGRLVYGDSQTTMYNGQVDYFLSGGGWGDRLIDGNVKVEIYDGVINAAMGSSYGYRAVHTITGDSDVNVYGGDYSGTTRLGPNTFSGGISNLGTQKGNAKLTIDLREYDGEFKLPGGTSISGGRPFNAVDNNVLGDSKDNTILLEIYTKPGVDSLNGATIYGDGGTAAAPTKSGSIKVRMNAQDSKVGSLYATQYSNLTGNQLLRNVEMNVQNVKQIGGLSGGSPTDAFTDAIANSTNRSVFNFGVDVSGDGVFQKDPILVSGVGVINFTEMTVDNGLMVTASSANIKNGVNAAAATHAATYSKFGDIHLKNNSGLGVANTTNYISGGILTVEGEGYIESGQGHGIINLSDVKFVDDDSRLNWIKNNTATTPTYNANGTWFGTQANAYQVLTINPTISNADTITPFNFKGIEKATGKTFIGDNDVTGSTNGYGIMIPGSVIDYIVKEPVLDGKGFIEHNVTDVKPNNDPKTLKVWGTEVAGTKVQKGRLIIPKSTGILPKLTFTPETTNTGSWFYSGKIVSSKLNSTDTILTERADSNPETWTSTDGDYSYEVEVRYSNQAELTARSIVLKESEATAISTEADVNGYTEVDGRPFLESNINAAKLAEINKPLAEDEYYRIVPVEYVAGTAKDNPANEIRQTVNIIVVKDGATVSNDKHSAIYAEDVTLKQAEIAGIESQTIFESDYSHAFAIESDGTIHAVVEDKYFEALGKVGPNDTPKDIPVNSTYTSKSGETIKKDTVIHVLPNSANLIVQFVDENGNSFKDENGDPIGPLTYTRDIGTTIDLKTEQDVLDAIAAIEGQDYAIDERPDANPIEIVNGGSTVTYKFKGTLTFFTAPENIDFGLKNTGSYGALYADKPTFDQHLVVKDNRATQTNWKLNVKVTKMMTSLDDEDYTLPDSLKYKNDDGVQVLTEGISKTIFAGKHPNAGNYDVSQKEWLDKDNGFVMDISTTQYRKLGDYQATIQFTLEETP